MPGFSTAAVARLLAADAAELRNEVEALPAEVRSWHPAPGEWCVNEVLGHLVEAERRGFSGRIRILLDSENPQLETWNQEEVARERRDCDREGPEVLAELLAERVISVELVEGLSDESLGRGGVHVTIGPVTVGNATANGVTSSPAARADAGANADDSPIAATIASARHWRAQVALCRSLLSIGSS